MKSAKMVVVAWQDSAGMRPVWVAPESAKSHKPSKIVTVGWLVKDGKKAIVLVQSLSNSDQIGNPLAIPRGCIESMHELKVDG